MAKKARIQRRPLRVEAEMRYDPNHHQSNSYARLTLVTEVLETLGSRTLHYNERRNLGEVSLNGPGSTKAQQRIRKYLGQKGHDPKLPLEFYGAFSMQRDVADSLKRHTDSRKPLYI